MTGENYEKEKTLKELHVLRGTIKERKKALENERKLKEEQRTRVERPWLGQKETHILSGSVEHRRNVLKEERERKERERRRSSGLFDLGMVGFSSSYEKGESFGKGDSHVQTNLENLNRSLEEISSVLDGVERTRDNLNRMVSNLT